MLHLAHSKLFVAHAPDGSSFCVIATQELPLVCGSGFGLETVGTDIGNIVGVTNGLGAFVGESATVGEDGRPVSHEIPDPPHLFGKNRRTSSVIVSSNLLANFVLPETVGWVKSTKSIVFVLQSNH